MYLIKGRMSSSKETKDLAPCTSNEVKTSGDISTSTSSSSPHEAQGEKKEIETRKKRRSSRTPCIWCDEPDCRCCQCPGYLMCVNNRLHGEGKKCKIERYARRSVCNRCERNKLRSLTHTEPRSDTTGYDGHFH
jgi:hypothetical protein